MQINNRYEAKTRDSGKRSSISWWLGGIFAVLIATLYVGSFFLDRIVRSRIEATMNQKLKGHHLELARAHLQLVGGLLTLTDLRIVQQAHPHPAVAEVPIMRFHIEWKELLYFRVVAEVFSRTRKFVLTRPN
jgi:hypothetical protein